MLDRYSRLTNQIVNHVNDSRGVGRRTRDSIAPSKLRKSFLETLQQATQLKLATGLVSEASVRLKMEGHLLATPPESWFATLEDKQLIIASDSQLLDGDALPHHIELHRKLYSQDTQVNALFICQPTAALVCIEQGWLPTNKFEQIDLRIWLGELEQLSGENNASLVKGVGLITTGKTIQEAVATADLVNRLCEMEINMMDR